MVAPRERSQPLASGGPCFVGSLSWIQLVSVVEVDIGVPFALRNAFLLLN